MKKELFAAVLAGSILFTGCAKAPAEPAVTATAAPTVPTTEVTKPTKPEPTEVTLPWDFPEVEPMTYEEYFSEKREVTENYCEDADRLYLAEDSTPPVYSLRDEHGKLVLREDSYTGKKTIATLCENEENNRWMILAKDRAFAVQDDRSIIMLDLRTMEKSVLYTQEDGIVLLDTPTTGFCSSWREHRDTTHFTGCICRKRSWMSWQATSPFITGILTRSGPRHTTRPLRANIPRMTWS